MNNNMILSNLKEMIKYGKIRTNGEEDNIKCFYHCDNDGRLAAYFVHLYTQNTNRNNYIEVDYVNRVPSADIVNDGDIVYIVDTSFTKDTLNLLQDIANKAKKVYWFDHHKSSKEIIDNYIEELNGNIYYRVDMNRCGAMITFDELFPDINHPTILKLVDDHDRWQKKYPQSNYFKLATDGIPLSDMENWDKVEKNLDNLIDFGERLDKYMNIVNSEDFKNNGYTCTINGKKCLVMNKPGNSAVFGKYYNDTHLAIMWCFMKEKFKYSVYSELPDIDCSKIAQFFNPKGGGHKGAAGWASDKMDIKPYDVFEIPM